MEEFNFEELLNDYLPEEKSSGDKITGFLVRKDDNYGYLNINNKLEGRIKIQEIENLNIGEELKVQIVKTDEDFIVVSKTLLEKNEYLSSLKKGDRVKGKVFSKIKGGYKINLKLATAYLPFKFSGLNSNYIPNGEEFEFEIVDKSSKNIVLSRLNILEESKNKTLDNINLGDIINGEVTNKLDYGLIVSIDDLSALLHFSELSWDNKLSIKNFKVGDKVKAKIIELDKENKKIKLSIKQLTENPWIKIKEKYPIGKNIDTKIIDTLQFGVLVNLDGREEFIHSSELSYKKINNVNKEYKKGNTLFCEVIDHNDEKEKIVLSPKTVFEKIWVDIEHIYSLNDVITTTVTNIKDFGIFTKTDENLEIFIPKSEFSWDKNFKPKFKIDDKIDVKLIEIKKDEKNLVGSIKRLGVSPYEIASSKYLKNTTYELIVTDIIENGVLVKLTDDFKGLIPKKEISGEINKNDTVKAVVIEKNSNKNSILLSIKKVVELEERKELDELMKIYGV